MRPQLCVGILLAWTASFQPARAQSFSFVPEHLVLSDTVGSEMAFVAAVTNLTQSTLTLTFIRQLNQLPPSWASSMCLDVCYPPTVDTIATLPEYGSSPLAPGETRSFSMHVYAMGEPGTGYVRVLVMDRRNESDSLGVMFTASATSTGIAQSDESPLQFVLGQNYPNPFNGETRIGYSVPKTGDGGVVTLTVYDLLGREVATLLEEQACPGQSSVRFDAQSLTSGTYYYVLQQGTVHLTRRMLLLR